MFLYPSRGGMKTASAVPLAGASVYFNPAFVSFLGVFFLCSCVLACVHACMGVLRREDGRSYVHHHIHPSSTCAYFCHGTACISL